MKRSSLFLLGMFFVVAPQVVHGQVVISEIMYDLEGTDTGREWVEIHNTSGVDVDLSSWKFFESETNHGLTVAQGSGVVPASGFAVIADTPAKFLADWSGYSGVLFDSSFSLSNTGELLSLKNGDAVVDTVSYASDQGALGDGNSLQKSGSSWLPATPTPGAANASSASAPPPASTSTENSNSNTSTTGTSGTSSSVPVADEEAKITAGIDAPKNSITGVAMTLLGKSWGLKGEPLLSARYLWAFGDGSMQEGESVVHIYAIPGEYAAVLEVSSGKYSASARSVVVVAPSRVTVQSIKSGADGFIELANGANVEVDLSYWQLAVGSSTFVIPKNTRILPGKSAMFPNTVTNLSPAENTALYYPNGTKAAAYDTPNIVAPATVAEASEQKSLATAESSTPPPARSQSVASVSEAEESVSASSSLAALAVSQEAPTDSSYLKWMLMLGGVIAVGAGAYWVGGREKRDEFEIIDVSDKD